MSELASLNLSTMKPHSHRYIIRGAAAISFGSTKIKTHRRARANTILLSVSAHFRGGILRVN